MPEGDSYTFFLVYQLRTGFCRLRNDVKERFNTLAVQNGLELGWERDVYRTEAFRAVINQIGIFNGMFFGVDARSLPSTPWERARALSDFMDASLDIEGWSRIFLVVNPQLVRLGREIPVRDLGCRDVRPALENWLASGEGVLLAFDPGPCAICGL
jgi:hypothetical protein